MIPLDDELYEMVTKFLAASLFEYGELDKGLDDLLLLYCDVFNLIKNDIDAS